MARVPRAPRRPRGGTPAGMEGVRPGSPAAVAAGYRPPRPPRPPRTPPGYVGQAGTGNPYAGFSGTPTVVAPTPSIAPPAAAAPPPPPAPTFQPTSAWWISQLAADPRYMTTAPLLDEQRAGIGRSYGFTIVRDAQGRPTYRTAAGATGITQQLDDKGAIVYRDAAGNTYKPGDLQLDIQRVQRGQPGYLSGQFGAAEAGSEARRYGIADVSAQSGIRRSGMQQSAEQQEFNALQSALAGLTSRAGAELAGVDEKFAELYREIYGDLAKRADELAAPVAPTETPAAPPAAPPVETGPQTATPPGMEGIRPGTGPWWDRLNPGQSSGGLLVPPGSRGNFTVSGRPGGSPPQNPAPGTAYMGNGGVVWVYRSQGPNGAGWYRRP